MPSCTVLRCVALACLALPEALTAQPSTLLWTGAFNSTGVDAATAVAADAAGNIYTTGYFSNTADLDPGVGVANFVSFGGFDMFVTKTDATGNFIWAKQFGGSLQDISRSITTDALGNVYVTGSFRGVADFDPNVGTTTLASLGVDDAYVLKLSPAGNLTWAFALGSMNQDVAYDAVIDGTGNVFISGNFTNTVDFDPGAGSTTLTSNAGQPDIFVLKVNAAGSFLWVRSAGGIFPDNGYSIALDAAGNAIVTGSFMTAVDFDPGAGVLNMPNAGGWDIYLWKLDTAGNLIWVRTMGGLTDEAGDQVVVDASGDILITGFFNTTVDFDPNAGISNLVAAGQSDVFVAKYTATGLFTWAKGMGSTSADVGMHLATDAANNSYSTGYFTAVADFDPGLGVVSRTCAGSQDLFVVELNSVGSFVCVETFGSTASDVGQGVAIGPGGSIITSGFFTGTVDLDPAATITTLASNTNSLDGFVHRMAMCGSVVLPIELLVFDGYAEPWRNKLYWSTASEQNNDYFTLEKSIDLFNWSTVGIVDGAENSQSILHYDYLDADIVEPIQYYRLRQTDLDGVQTLSQVVVISRTDIELTNLYPNPNSGEELMLQLISRVETDVTLIGTGPLGQRLLQRRLHVVPGVNTYAVPLTELAASVIHFQARTDGGAATSVKRLVLSH